jgi:hypothetical protein
MAPFTKQMLLEDFARGVELLAQVTHPLFPASVIEGLEPDDGRGRPLTGAALTHAMPAGNLLSDAYDFAFEGVWRRGNFAEELAESRQLVSIFKGLSQTVTFEGPAFELCLRTVQVARLRALLEGAFNLTSEGMLPHHIHLSELADLAGLEDKTLRNMTSAKQPNPLKTVKANGRTYISLNVAIPFLLSRGFKLTIVEDFSAERNFSELPFISTRDLSEYLRRLRESLGWDASQLARRAGGALKAEDIERYESGEQVPEEAVLKRLAKALHVKHAKQFITSALEQAQPFYDAV